ncbi:MULTISPECIES: hypothetical protein [unclassified Pseudomonas]|uniref:hypothetical protein n=1 Tax=unclassified Pseudomonas TaxID=196821 RepID=UPI000A1F82C9|nr:MULTISPECIES: hypothetical protein [unclassified Pseudomonas]MDI2143653.1 hypothetical protein [Pseudomonas sp. ITA]
MVAVSTELIIWRWPAPALIFVKISLTCGQPIHCRAKQALLIFLKDFLPLRRRKKQGDCSLLSCIVDTVTCDLSLRKSMLEELEFQRDIDDANIGVSGDA